MARLGSSIRHGLAAGVLLAAATAGPPAAALERGGLPGDGAWVSGGVGLDEIEALDAERRQHSLWIVTAAKGSGAYLSGAIVRIAGSDGRPVFERALAGPWLLIDLVPGRYAVDVVFEQAALHRDVVVRAGGAGPRQLLFYFAVPGEEAAAATGR